MPNPVLRAAAQAYKPRTRAASAPPASQRRYGGGAGEPARVPVGVTGHRTKWPSDQVGLPGPHPAHPSSPIDPGDERWPISPPLAPLIAQLVSPLGPQASQALRCLRAERRLKRARTYTPTQHLPNGEALFSTAPPPSGLSQQN
jgi:hypothetical protein